MSGETKPGHPKAWARRTSQSVLLGWLSASFARDCASLPGLSAGARSTAFPNHHVPVPGGVVEPLTGTLGASGLVLLGGVMQNSAKPSGFVAAPFVDGIGVLMRLDGMGRVRWGQEADID